MRIRYISYLALAVTAGFLVVASYAFTLPVLADIALGAGIAMLVVALGVALMHRRDLPTVAISGVIGAISAFLVVATQVFALATIADMTFGLGLAIAGLAVLGLTLNELVTERVVHRLEVRQRRDDRAERHEPLAA